MMAEQEKLKISIEGTSAEVKSILSALSLYAGVVKPVVQLASTLQVVEEIQQPATEKKTSRSKKVKEEVQPSEIAESVVVDQVVSEVQPSENEMPKVEVNLTPAQELQPAPEAELQQEVSAEFMLNELKKYCVRMRGKYPQKTEEEVTIMGRALCFVHGGSETGAKGVLPEKRQSVINAAQDNWEPDNAVDAFGEI